MSLNRATLIGNLCQDPEVKVTGNDLGIGCVMPAFDSINFKHMRKLKGLTLRQVEQKTGISNSYLSQLESGKIKSPSYNSVRTLYCLYINEA